MLKPTTDQVSGVTDRVLTIAATWLLTWLTMKGYITPNQAVEYSPLLIALGAAIWGWWVNRPKAILQSAAAIPAGGGKMTQIVTSPELAAATPEQANIISSAENKVVDTVTNKTVVATPPTK